MEISNRMFHNYQVMNSDASWYFKNVFLFLVMVEAVYFRVPSCVILKMGLIIQKYKNKKLQNHYSEGINRSGGMILEFWINKNTLIGDYFVGLLVLQRWLGCVC